MDKITVSILCTASFVVGMMVGHSDYKQSDKKEITKLSIELTKLKIKELKGL